MQSKTGACLWLALTGCGSAEVARLEVEQNALEKEVETLRSNVAGLRQEMVEVGLIKGGPGAGGGAGGEAGNPLPETEISGDLPWTFTRTGAPPALPSLGPPERRQKTNCGYKFSVRQLQPLSDFSLNSAGAGKASPVLLFEDGQPLTPHAMPHDFEQNCRFAFRHAGFLIMFTPDGKPASAHGKTYTVALDSAFPLQRGDDGRDLFWIYPGQTATLSLSKGWNPDWGSLSVDLDARLVYVGKTNSAPATASVLGVDEKSARPRLGMSAQIETPPSDAFEVTIASPGDGPYVLIETLTLGNAQHAVVVTSEAAFRESQN